MKHDCVGDEGIGDRERLGYFCKRDFRVWRRRQWWNWWLAGWTAAIRFWRFGWLLHQRIGIAHKATASRGSSLKDPVQRLGPQWSANEVWKFCYTGKLQPGDKLHWVEKKLQNLNESTAQRHKGHSGSVAQTVKHEFKKRPKKGNCFGRGINGHFDKDCRRKDTGQCIKCREKSHLDRACRRQRDGGKHESVVMGPTLASPDEDHRAALTQWNPAALPGLCALSISGQKSQRRGFQSCGHRQCEDQHTFKQKKFQPVLDEESTATRGNLRESESLKHSDTEDFSQSETVGFFEESLEQTDRAETRQETRARIVP